MKSFIAALGLCAANAINVGANTPTSDMCDPKTETTVKAADNQPALSVTYAS